MREISLWKSWLIFSLGCFLTLAFAGPLGGAMLALSWSNHDSASRRDTADHIYAFQQNAEERASRGIIFELVGPGPCESRLIRKMDSADPKAKALLWKAYRNLSRGQEDIQSYIRREPVIDSLLSSPPVLLGLLDGCLGRSLFSGYCAAYVSDRVHAAREASGYVARLDKERRDDERVWCLLAYMK